MKEGKQKDTKIVSLIKRAESLPYPGPGLMKAKDPEMNIT